MNQHLLDPNGSVSVPHGYVRVDSEVGFLKAATAGKPLQVCGERLCQWAELFFKGRGEGYRYARPLAEELCDVCPGLSVEQAQKIVRQLGVEAVESLRSPLEVDAVLQRLYPMDLWRRLPSSQHVAEWLVWIVETDPPNHIWPLLAYKGSRWQQGLNQPESAFYQLKNRDEAVAALEEWAIGEGKSGIATMFPETIPDVIMQRITERLKSELVQSKAKIFSTLVKREIPFSLKEWAARYTASYYERNPAEITREGVQELSPFLNRGEIIKLDDILPPMEPASMPDDPSDVLIWFRESYFPFREWQGAKEDESMASEVALEAARQFAIWYLGKYPQALVGGALAPYLAMNRMVALSNEREAVTLVVVLDGLHFGDARNLMKKIANAAPRLTTASDDLAFASLPTITRFCKPSLLNGVPPRLVDETEPMGRVVGDRSDPAKTLSRGAPGDVFLWRVAEPDETYHSRNNAEQLRQEVDGSLNTVAQKIREIVNIVPEHILLQIVVTTDHGRLLGRSVRKIATPPDMESHGRAAWGGSSIAFGNHAHFVDGKVAYLHGYSFGLPEDAAIVLDESAFQTNDQRGGSELYPHGGLFPEEVIVPWVAYERDVRVPSIDVSISGSGIARREGVLEVHVVNMDMRAVTVSQLEFILADGARVVRTELAVGPQADQQFRVDLEPWFSAEEADMVKASVRVVLNNGLEFELPADLSVEAEDMYRRDNILEDLF